MNNLKSIFANKVILKSYLRPYDRTTEDKETVELLKNQVIKNNIIKYTKNNKIENVNVITKTIKEFDNRLFNTPTFCKYNFKDKNFDDVMTKFKKFIEFHNNNCEDDEKLRFINSYCVDNKKIFEGQDLEIYQFSIKKKNDIDILTFEECLIENQQKLIDLKIFTNEMQYRNTYVDQTNSSSSSSIKSILNFWSLNYKTEETSKTSSVDKFELREIFENFSYGFKDKGFIEEEHLSNNTENLKINQCEILKQWLECYKAQDKEGTSKNWKYIEKVDKIFINKKICTILVED